MAWGHRVYSWQVSVRFLVGRQRMKRNTQVVRARPDRRPAAPPPALGGPAAVAAAAIAASGGVGGVSPPPLAATCDASAASRRVVRLASRCRVSARGDRLGATRADGFFDYEQGATGVVGGLDRGRRGGGGGDVTRGARASVNAVAATATAAATASCTAWDAAVAIACAFVVPVAAIRADARRPTHEIT